MLTNLGSIGRTTRIPFGIDLIQYDTGDGHFICVSLERTERLKYVIDHPQPVGRHQNDRVAEFLRKRNGKIFFA